MSTPKMTKEQILATILAQNQQVLNFLMTSSENAPADADASDRARAPARAPDRAPARARAPASASESAPASAPENATPVDSLASLQSSTSKQRSNGPQRQKVSSNDETSLVTGADDEAKAKAKAEATVGTLFSSMKSTLSATQNQTVSASAPERASAKNGSSLERLRNTTASGGSEHHEVVASHLKKVIHESCRDALLYKDEEAELNSILNNPGFPKHDFPKSRKYGLTKFEIVKSQDSTRTSEISNLLREINSLEQQIADIKAKHKTQYDKAKEKGKLNDERVKTLLHGLLAKKDPLETSLKSKRESLAELKKELPKPAGLSAEENDKLSAFLDSSTNPHIVEKVSQPFWIIISFLRISHASLKRSKPKSLDGSEASGAVDGSEASEAVDAVDGSEAGGAVDGKKSKKDGKRFARVTVYPDMERVPVKRPELKRNDVLLSVDVDSFLRLLECASHVKGFTEIFAFFHEANDPVQDQKNLRRFIQFKKVMGCDDKFPSDDDLRRALCHIVDAVEYYKNATPYAKLSLNESLSRKNFQKVFVEAKPVFKKEFTFTRPPPEDLFARECQFARAAGGGSAEENIETLMNSFHRSMQGVGKSGLPLIGNQAVRSVEQYTLYRQIAEHSAVKKSELTTLKFLESNKVISIFEQKGTKYFTVLPLPADDE